jgi:hypothetical protein
MFELRGIGLSIFQFIDLGCQVSDLGLEREVASTLKF